MAAASTNPDVFECTDRAFVEFANVQDARLWRRPSLTDILQNLCIIQNEWEQSQTPQTLDAWVWAVAQQTSSKDPNEQRLVVPWLVDYFFEPVRYDGLTAWPYDRALIWPDFVSIARRPLAEVESTGWWLLTHAERNYSAEGLGNVDQEVLDLAIAFFEEASRRGSRTASEYLSMIYGGQSEANYKNDPDLARFFQVQAWRLGALDLPLRTENAHYSICDAGAQLNLLSDMTDAHAQPDVGDAFWNALEPSEMSPARLWCALTILSEAGLYSDALPDEAPDEFLILPMDLFTLVRSLDNPANLEVTRINQTTRLRDLLTPKILCDWDEKTCYFDGSRL